MDRWSPASRRRAGGCDPAAAALRLRAPPDRPPARSAIPTRPSADGTWFDPCRERRGRLPAAVCRGRPPELRVAERRSSVARAAVQTPAVDRARQGQARGARVHASCGQRRSDRRGTASRVTVTRISRAGGRLPRTTTSGRAGGDAEDETERQEGQLAWGHAGQDVLARERRLGGAVARRSVTARPEPSQRRIAPTRPALPSIRAGW